MPTQEARDEDERLREIARVDEDALAQGILTLAEPIPEPSGSLPPELDAFNLSTLQIAILLKVDFSSTAFGSPLDTRAITPAEARIFFEDLAEDEQQQILLSLPTLVAGMDGAPHKLRYQANRILIEEAIASLEGTIKNLEMRLQRIRQRPTVSPQLVQANEVVLSRFQDRRNLLQRWAKATDRQFLLLDVRGDGNVVEVIGDLETADHVMVFIPGVSHDLNNYERRRFSLNQRVNNLFDGMNEIDPNANIAVISWLGFNPPDSLLTAARSSPARHGAPALARFLEGLLVDAGHDFDLTVVGHSYGSVVAGRSLAFGLARWADTLIVVGSPGVGVETVADIEAFDLPANRFYAMMANDDPIRHTPFGIHGPLPISIGFGAQRLDSLEASGHSEYFNAGQASLRQITSIALRRLDDLIFVTGQS